MQVRSWLSWGGTVAASIALSCGADPVESPKRADTLCAPTPGAAGCAAAGTSVAAAGRLAPAANGGTLAGPAAGTPAIITPVARAGAGGIPVVTPPSMAAGRPGAGFPPSTPAAGSSAPATGNGAGAGATPPAPAAGSGSSATAGAPAPAGPNITGIEAAELEMLRNVCVETINMYRASAPQLNLKPLKRATPAQEECSDRAAKQDGDTGQAHGAFSAGLCRTQGFSSQNTCPGYPVGGFGGGATIEAAMKTCLKQMWDEGEPPVSRQECMADYQGCFLKHGHYINMSGSAAGVSCGFYKMMSGNRYWMNQDFTFR